MSGKNEKSINWKNLSCFIDKVYFLAIFERMETRKKDWLLKINKKKINIYFSRKKNKNKWESIYGNLFLSFYKSLLWLENFYKVITLYFEYVREFLFVFKNLLV